jgi:hypothetical protein
MTFSQFGLFIPAALLAAASPGVNNLLSFTHGIKAGFLHCDRILYRVLLISEILSGKCQINVRQLPPVFRFLNIAGQLNGQMVSSSSQSSLTLYAWKSSWRKNGSGDGKGLCGRSMNIKVSR